MALSKIHKQNLKNIYIFFFYFPENYSRRFRKSTNKKFWPEYLCSHTEGEGDNNATYCFDVDPISVTLSCVSKIFPELVG